MCSIYLANVFVPIAILSIYLRKLSTVDDVTKYLGVSVSRFFSDGILSGVFLDAAHPSLGSSNEAMPELDYDSMAFDI